MSPPTTRELLERARRDEVSAWEELVARYNRLVWHVVLGFTRLSTECQADVHSTTWLRFAENLDRIEHPEQIGSWLATTARRECIRLARDASRVVLESEPPDIGAHEPLENHLLENERQVALWAAFRALDDHCQQILRLLFATDPAFTHAEVGAILGMPRTTVTSRVRTCLDTMRKHRALRDLGFDDANG